MDMGNCIIFNNTTVQKDFFVGLGRIQKITFQLFFFKSEFGTKKVKKNTKFMERVEMVIRRGVDRRVTGFKVKKVRS